MHYHLHRERKINVSEESVDTNRSRITFLDDRSLQEACLRNGLHKNKENAYNPGMTCRSEIVILSLGMKSHQFSSSLQVWSSDCTPSVSRRLFLACISHFSCRAALLSSIFLSSCVSSCVSWLTQTRCISFILVHCLYTSVWTCLSRCRKSRVVIIITIISFFRVMSQVSHSLASSIWTVQESQDEQKITHKPNTRWGWGSKSERICKGSLVVLWLILLSWVRSLCFLQNVCVHKLSSQFFFFFCQFLISHFTIQVLFVQRTDWLWTMEWWHTRCCEWIWVSTVD